MAKLQRERAEKVAVAALVVQFVLGLVAFGVARLVSPEGYRWATAVPAVGWFLLLGVGFWLMAWLHLRQLRLAETEQAEWERLLAEREAGGVRGALFEEDEIAAHAARNRLRILEKYVLPASGVALGVLLLLLGLSLMPVAGAAQVLDRGDSAQGASLMLIAAFGAFLLGMYASGMARHREWRVLKGGAGYMMASSALSALAVVALALAYAGYTSIFIAMAWVTPILMIALAAEIFLNFVLDFYRPRIEGVEYRPCYESRFLALLTEPAGIFRTVASTLDYQFGFKVSETWFYRFIERAIMPLVLFALVTLYLLTCVVIIGPSEVAVIERFGVPVEVNGSKALGPGLYIKWPWPISNVYREDASAIRKVSIGFDPDAEEAVAHARQTDYLWTTKHFEKEYWVMVAVEGLDIGEETRGFEVRAHDVAPVGLIAAVADVYYVVDDYEKYLYNVSDCERSGVGPRDLLRSLAYREQQKYFGGVDFFAVMGRDRLKVGADLHRNIQAAVDEVGLGIRVLAVSMAGIHPPVENDLGKAYQDVVAAEQEKQAEIHKGQAYANERLASSDHEPETILAAAHRDRVRMREAARGDALIHEKRILAYDMAPEVYRMNKYLDAFEESFANRFSRKYLVTRGGLDSEIYNIDLEDRVSLSPAGISLD